MASGARRVLDVGNSPLAALGQDGGGERLGEHGGRRRSEDGGGERRSNGCDASHPPIAGVLLLDGQRRIFAVDVGAERLLRTRAASLIGCDIEDILAVDEGTEAAHRRLAAHERPVASALLDRARRRREQVGALARRLDGSVLRVSISVAQWRGSVGGTFAVQLCCTEELDRLLAQERTAWREVERANRRVHSVVNDAQRIEDRVRRDVAEALHDDVVQELLAAHQDLAELAGGMSSVRRAADGVARSLERLRAVISLLHPAPCDCMCLETALVATAEAVATRCDIRVGTVVEADAASSHDRLILSFARELLSNVGRHAQATAAELRVRRDAGAIVLDVVDDGVGASPAAVDAALLRGHIGLATCAARAEAVGGSLRLTATPGGGTTVRIRLPIALS